MVRRTLKILQHLLQDFESVSYDHFGTLWIKGLRIVAFHLSEQVFMIFKNETVHYMMIITFVLLIS